MTDDGPAQGTVVVEPQVRVLAEWLHTTYDEIAADVGWQTQEDTRVPFADLPDENREVMRRLAARLLSREVLPGTAVIRHDNTRPERVAAIRERFEQQGTVVVEHEVDDHDGFIGVAIDGYVDEFGGVR